MGSERLRWEVTWGNDRILEVQTIKKEEKSRKIYLYLRKMPKIMEK
jgi:hypothetical protein